MLSGKVKDIKLRKFYNKFENKKLINKFIFTNLLNKKNQENNKKIEKINTILLQKQLNNKRNSKVRIVRRCVFNNRNRGVLRSFGISRVYLRELMLFGIVPGYSKAVW